MPAAVEQEYTFAAVARILDVPEAKLRYWSQSGFVGPSRRKGTRQVFTFQDLVGVRAAKELVERGFSPAQIRKALEQVRAALPGVDRPLERLRVAWDGQTLALVEDGAAFEVTGQRLFDFGLADLAAKAATLAAMPAPRPAASVSRAGAGNVERSAFEWFTLGLEHETAGRDEEAAAAYRKALAGDPGLAAAHTNLGALHYRAGDMGAARAAFEAALALDPEQAEARYDLARILFELGEVELSASELRRVVQSAPDFADAHYNLATALEELGSKTQAIEHLQRYLQLASVDDEDLGPWMQEARERLERLRGK
jgi:tetratricopeptide (TPR) repeat protein